jgi:dihydrofolate reductase
MARRVGRSAGGVMANITMSLDGFVAGPNDGVGNPLGDGGERIHRWQYELSHWREAQGLRGGKVNRDSRMVEESDEATGAFVMGRRMFDHGEDPWGDTPPFRRPVFVVTTRPRDVLAKDGGTTFTFVTEGIESALTQARAAAGDKGVAVAGGANVIQQFIRSGLLDELQVHVAPFFLGNGVRLFSEVPPGVELEPARVVASRWATHLKYAFPRR